ncbi:MAG: SDR family NAD(P)-dependent oxidoreductase [Gammaproteobacteria bacterium]
MNGRVVVFAGVANDVGLACAREFACQGAAVVVIDADRSTIEALRDGIRAGGGSACAIAADPADAAAILAAAGECRAQFGGVDVLVTCPMAMELGTIEASAPESWQRIVAANLLGPVFAAKAFLPLLRGREGASVVHVGSVDGVLGNPQLPAYSASKGGIVALTHVMAEEFAAYGIRVNCVARAMAMERGAEPNPMFAPLLAHTPLGRPGYFDEIAAVVRFLASADASYVTGAVIPVDGGRTALTPGTRRPR